MYSRRLSGLGIARNFASQSRSACAELAKKPWRAGGGAFSPTCCCCGGIAPSESASRQIETANRDFKASSGIGHYKVFFLHPDPRSGRDPYPRITAKGARFMRADFAAETREKTKGAKNRAPSFVNYPLTKLPNPLARFLQP